MTGNNQVGEGGTVAASKQGVAAGLVDEEVDELSPLDVLLGLAERFPLLGRLRKRDDLCTFTSGPATARNGERAILRGAGARTTAHITCGDFGIMRRPDLSLDAGRPMGADRCV